MKEQDEATRIRVAILLAADDVAKGGNWDFMDIEVPARGTPARAPVERAYPA